MLSDKERNLIRVHQLVYKPAPWDRILEECARMIGRPLSFEDASEILGKNFMRSMSNSDDVQVWCVRHRLTFKPSASGTVDALSQILKDVFADAITDTLATNPLKDFFKA